MINTLELAKQNYLKKKSSSELANIIIIKKNVVVSDNIIE